MGLSQRAADLGVAVMLIGSIGLCVVGSGLEGRDGKRASVLLDAMPAAVGQQPNDEPRREGTDMAQPKNGKTGQASGSQKPGDGKSAGGMGDMNAMNADMAACIEACGVCASTCTMTAAHCLDMGGEHAARGHQTLMADCADACAMAAAFMSRGSERHAEACELCARMCERCGKECERMAGGDEMMQRCAAACARCAEMCLKMSGAKSGR